MAEPCRTRVALCSGVRVWCDARDQEQRFARRQGRLLLTAPWNLFFLQTAVPRVTAKPHHRELHRQRCNHTPGQPHDELVASPRPPRCAASQQQCGPPEGGRHTAMATTHDDCDREPSTSSMAGPQSTLTTNLPSIPPQSHSTQPTHWHTASPERPCHNGATPDRPAPLSPALNGSGGA